MTDVKNSADNAPDWGRFDRLADSINKHGWDKSVPVDPNDPEVQTRRLFARYLPPTSAADVLPSEHQKIRRPAGQHRIQYRAAIVAFLVLISFAVAASVMAAKATAEHKEVQQKLTDREKAYADVLKKVELLKRTSSEVEDALLRMRQQEANLDKTQVNQILDVITAPRQAITPEDRSEFVKDVTLPDGATVKAGERVSKVWEIRNVGRVPWKNRFLTRVGRHDDPDGLQSDLRVPVPETAPGKQCPVSVDLIVPPKPGKYYAAWRMTDGEGNYLLPGQTPLYVLIRVMD